MQLDRDPPEDIPPPKPECQPAFPEKAQGADGEEQPLFALPAVVDLENPLIASAEASVQSQLPVSSMAVVAHARLLVVGTDTKLVEVAALLSSEQGSQAVVCDHSGAVQGVITDTMLVHQLGLASAHIFGTRASELMSREFESCRSTDSLVQVLATMHRRGLICVPVVDVGNRPSGVVYARDGLRALLAAGNFEEAQMRDYVMGVGYR